MAPEHLDPGLPGEWWISLDIIDDEKVLALSPSRAEATHFVISFIAACTRTWPKGELDCHVDEELECMASWLGLEKSKVEVMLNRGLDVGLFRRLEEPQEKLVTWSFHEPQRYWRFLGGRG